VGAAVLYTWLGDYRPVFWSLAGALVVVGAIVAVSGGRGVRVAEIAGRA
jgi:hypothetical protein